MRPRPPLALLLLISLAATPAPAQDPAPPVVKEVVIHGAEALSRERVLRAIRLRPGQPLYGDAAANAAALQGHYRSLGYPAAVVRGQFDPGAGVLTLDVDEGKLARVEVPGFEAAVADRLRRLADLSPGQTVRDEEIRRALTRVEEASAGALERGEPSFTTAPSPEGAVVSLNLVQHRGRLTLAPAGLGAGPAWNKVDGLTPWASVQLTRFDTSRFNHALAYGSAGYGFGSERVQWQAGGMVPFGPRRLVTLGYEAHDLTASDDSFRAVGFEPSPAALLVGPRAATYFGRRGQEGLLYLQPLDRLQLGVGYRADRYRSLPAADPGSDENPPIADGDMRSLLVAARFATPGPLFSSLRRERVAMLERSAYGTRREARQVLRLDATFEVSNPSLGGDFDFKRLILDGRGVRPVGHALEARLRGLLGASWGEVPPQKQLALGGLGTLRARKFGALPGQHVGLLTGELAWKPGRRWVPGVAAFYDGGVAWTPGHEGEGWLSDLGLGLEWPADHGLHLRVDGAWAANPLPGDDHRVRATGRLLLPF